jgi:hypothetical protein
MLSLISSKLRLAKSLNPAMDTAMKKPSLAFFTHSEPRRASVSSPSEGQLLEPSPDNDQNFKKLVACQ